MRGEAQSGGARLQAQERRLSLLVVHLASPTLRAHVEIEDLVQEVWLRALAAPEGWPAQEPGEAGLARWLATLARHVVIDAARALRAKKRDARVQRLDPSDWSRVGPAERAAGPRTRAAGREAEARLQEAFARLPPEHRRVIALRQLTGLSARETAAHMGRSEVAVHSLFRRALAAWEEASRGMRDESAPGSRWDRA
jgi:RNA polymerase sigma-70 factor (ECF subfamily)